MKKQLTALSLLLCLLLTMVGCAAAGRTLDAAEDRVEAQLDIVEDRIEQKLETPKSPAAETLPLLAEEEARQIALKHLGLSADQVQHLRSSYEIDDGIPQYDVEFHHGDWEYEFEIHGQTGAILSYDKDHIYD